MAGGRAPHHPKYIIAICFRPQSRYDLYTWSLAVAVGSMNPESSKSLDKGICVEPSEGSLYYLRYIP